MKTLISCDWGTSSFRLRLVDITTGKVLSELNTNQGIKDTFSAWNANKNEANDRQTFYSNILSEQIKNLNDAGSLNGIPVIISGMASSSIGLLDLPYKELPFSTDGIDLLVHTIRATEDCPHAITLVSGAKTATDVLRGEETILIGCEIPLDEQKRLYIFPGTHSKHIIVQQGKVVDFTTYMTGEFFDLLANKSILAASVKKDIPAHDGIYEAAFKKGVLKGANVNLLSSAFKVRINQLNNKLTATENYNYLSGLLIGCELNTVNRNDDFFITIVAGQTLLQQYLLAFQVLGFDKNIQGLNADTALVNGHCKLYKKLLHADKT